MTLDNTMLIMPAKSLSFFIVSSFTVSFFIFVIFSTGVVEFSDVLPSAHAAADFSLDGNQYWRNDDLSTSAHLNWIDIGMTDSTIWARCSESYCDSGTQSGYIDGNLGVILWDDGFAKNCMVLIVDGNQLTIKTTYVSRIIHEGSNSESVVSTVTETFHPRTYVE